MTYPRCCRNFFSQNKQILSANIECGTAGIGVPKLRNGTIVRYGVDLPDFLMIVRCSNPPSMPRLPSRFRLPVPASRTAKAGAAMAPRFMPTEWFPRGRNGCYLRLPQPVDEVPCACDEHQPAARRFAAGSSDGRPPAPDIGFVI